MARVGVLLTAYGGPRGLDEVVPFMCSIMGTEPSPDTCERARIRYLTIGGLSPLPFTAERIAVQLERELSGLPPAEDPEDESGLGFMGRPRMLPRALEGVRIPVAVGMLHSEPSIATAVRELAAAGTRTLVVSSLSPFEAHSTTGRYRAAVDAAVAEVGGMHVVEAASYRTLPQFVDVLVNNLTVALGDEHVEGKNILVAFTAHSLPVQEVAADTSYVDQLRETAAMVAERVGLGEPDGFESLPGMEAFGGHGGTWPWLLAFQSKGRRGGEWLGPDLDAVIDAAAGAGFEAVVVSPVGFALDHMETLYDLDVEAAERTLDHGLEFARAAAPNEAPAYIEAIAEAIRKVL